MKQHLQLLVMVLGVTLLMAMVTPTPGFAQAAPAAAPVAAAPATPPSSTGGLGKVFGNNGDTCTNFASLETKAKDGSTPGILTNITQYIKDVVNTASEDLFKAFTSSSTYKGVVNAAVTLMVVIYAVGFMMGVVQASFGQILVRLIKVGIIYALISPTGWQFFSDYVVKFFNEGTDEFIGQVMQIGTGMPFAAGDSPFKALDGLATVVLSPDMMIAILGATLNGGPFGLAMGGLIGFAVFGLVQLIISGLRLYATAFVVRSLLLGVAPIFIVFLLFERTKQLFSGWLNVMVLLSLQPILYFTFISFFVVMLSSASTNMMGGAEVCWTEFKGVEGSQNKVSGWRFKEAGASAPEVDGWDWKGQISCRMNGGKDDKGNPCAPFPINIVDLLTFLILIYVATKFGPVVENIATEISNAFVNLDQGAKMDLGMANKGAAGTGGGGGPMEQASNAKPAPTGASGGARPGG